jgi:hypothetical protein
MATIGGGESYSEREGSSRKRQKISGDGTRISSMAPATTAVTAIATASATSTASAASSHARTSGNCHHEAALQSLHTDINAMRDLITCQVCHKFMYEPYALSCGHTYCYTCLSQWLGANRKKTCPDCRAVIVQQPVPSYVIRELVLIFASRNQLLPDGETTDEHETMAKEEAAIVANDKANEHDMNGGLFKGVFKRGRQHRMPIHDPGDNVDRCPDCNWEIEDGYCNNCGQPVGDDDMSDFDDDDTDSLASLDRGEMDHELLQDLLGHGAVPPGLGPHFVDDDFYGDDDFDDDDMDDVDRNVFTRAFGGPAPGRQPNHRRPRAGRVARRAHSPIDISSDVSDQESDDDEDEDEHDSEMDGFIDDAEDGGPAEAPYDTDNTEVQYIGERLPRRRETTAVVISDDEQEAATRAGAVYADSDESDEEEPIAPRNRVNKRPRTIARPRPIAIDSDDDESSDDDGDDEPDSPATVTPGGFSPPVQDSDIQSVGNSHYYSEARPESDAQSMTSTRYDSEAPSSVAGNYDNMDPGEMSEEETESSSDEESEIGWG